MNPNPGVKITLLWKKKTYENPLVQLFKFFLMKKTYTFSSLQSLKMEQISKIIFDPDQNFLKMQTPVRI